MQKSIIALLLLVSGSAFATEKTPPENQALLDSVISKIESTYDLKCELARRQGEFLNPYICGLFACHGKERFVCRTQNGEKKFSVRAKFVYYNDGSLSEIKRIKIRDLN